MGVMPPNIFAIETRIHLRRVNEYYQNTTIAPSMTNFIGESRKITEQKTLNATYMLLKTLLDHQPTQSQNFAYGQKIEIFA